MGVLSLSGSSWKYYSDRLTQENRYGTLNWGKNINKRKKKKTNAELQAKLSQLIESSTQMQVWPKKKKKKTMEIYGLINKLNFPLQKNKRLNCLEESQRLL